MRAKIKAMVEQAKSLSRDEREALIAALQTTLDPVDPQWETTWLKECVDRIAAVELGAMSLIDASEVMVQARDMLRG